MSRLILKTVYLYRYIDGSISSVSYKSRGVFQGRIRKCQKKGGGRSWGPLVAKLKKSMSVTTGRRK